MSLEARCRNLGSQALDNAVTEIAEKMGIPGDEAWFTYHAVLAAHNRHVVQGKGRLFENHVKAWIEEDILPLYPGSKYVTQANAPGSKGARSGRNPVDGVLSLIGHGRRRYLSVCVKWSGKAGSLQSVVESELLDVRQRYRGFPVRLLLIMGQDARVPEILRSREDIMTYELGDKNQPYTFLQALKFWMAS